MNVSRTLETFGWHAKGSLGALSLWNNAIRGSSSSGLPCGAAVGGQCVQSSDVFVQVEWTLQFDVNRNKLPGDSPK